MKGLNEFRSRISGRSIAAGSVFAIAFAFATLPNPVQAQSAGKFALFCSSPSETSCLVGESQAAGFEGYSNLSAYTHTLSMPSEDPDALPPCTVIIDKAVDSSSPMLWIRTVRGKVQPYVKIVLTRTDQTGSTEIFFIAELRSVEFLTIESLVLEEGSLANSIVDRIQLLPTQLRLTYLSDSGDIERLLDCS